jgi:hypothetical protein
LARRGKLASLRDLTFFRIATRGFFKYAGDVFGLTRQQLNALGVVIFLLLTGWAVKAWRTAHPPPAAEPAGLSEP